MSSDLVKRLREDHCQCVNEPEYKPIRCYTCEAADRVEALEAEVARLKASLGMKAGLANVIGGTLQDVDTLVDAAKIAAEKYKPLLHAANARAERLREALTRLRDCDWVISLPDRMDAVREIARKALEDDKQ